MSTSRKYRLGGFVIAVILVEAIFWGLAWWGYQLVVADETFRFEHPDSLYFLYGLALLPIVYGIMLLQSNRWNKRLADDHLRENITSRMSNTRAIVKYVLLRFALGSLIIALANPQFGEEQKEGKAQGVELMIALDISNSMLARDLSATRSRLNIAKRSIERLLTKLKNDKIGIVVFAGSAYTQLPITSDYSAAKLFLSSIETGMLSSQGTAIGAAIDECLTAFDFEKETSKAIIILSDGENHEEGAIEAVQRALNKGVFVHTIGMGTTRGTPIELYKNGRKTGVKKDQNGNTVITKLNEEMLRELAQEGMGSYTRAQNANVGLNPLLEELRKMDQTVLSKEEFMHHEDHFQWFLALGLILLIVDTMILLRPRKIESNG